MWTNKLLLKKSKLKSEILNFSLLGLIGVLCFFVLKEDISQKKIKNKVLLWGFFAGVGLFLGGYLLGFFQLTYLRDVFVNFVLALAVGYFFWLISFWPAGDAKFFALLAFLLPLHYYWKSYLSFFPSLMLLVNIFVCAYGVLFGRAVVHLGNLVRKRDPFLFDFFSKIKRLFSLSGWASLLKEINFPTVVKSVAMLVGMFILMNYILKPKNVGTYTLMKNSLLGVTLWLVASLLIKKSIADKELRVEKFSELKSGTLLLITLHDQEIFSKDFLEKLGPLKAEGLDERQVQLVKELGKAKGVENINTQRHMPFAPWIVVGLLVTILLNDNLWQFFMRRWF